MASPVKPRIFLSHSHKDNLFCRPFVAHLRAALNLSDPDDIFYDEATLHLGDAWLERIQHEVLARPVFLVILTPNSVAADYVRTETNLALRETISHRDERWIVSILAEECEPNQLAPLLGNYQMANFARKPYDVAFAELVAFLTSIGVGNDERTLTDDLRSLRADRDKYYKESQINYDMYVKMKVDRDKFHQELDRLHAVQQKTVSRDKYEDLMRRYEQMQQEVEQLRKMP